MAVLGYFATRSVPPPRVTRTTQLTNTNPPKSGHRDRRRAVVLHRRLIEVVGDFGHRRRNVSGEDRAGGHRVRECVSYFAGSFDIADEHGVGNGSGWAALGGAGARWYAATLGNCEWTLRSVVARRRKNRVLQGQRYIPGEQRRRRRAPLADGSRDAELLTMVARRIDFALYGERSANQRARRSGKHPPTAAICMRFCQVGTIRLMSVAEAGRRTGSISCFRQRAAEQKISGRYANGAISCRPNRRRRS